MIDLVNISKIYTSESPTLDDVTLSVEEGETLALLGSSGSGKTTALTLVNRLEDPTSGTVRVAGRDVSGVDVHELRRSIERDLDPGILYEAVATGEVDVVFGFATDGRIDSYGLEVLADDRGFFPPYEAAPLARTDALEANPGLGPALSALAGALPDSTMRRLNREADEGAGSVAEIVRRFVEERGLGGS